MWIFVFFFSHEFGILIHTRDNYLPLLIETVEKSTISERNRVKELTLYETLGSFRLESRNRSRIKPENHIFFRLRLRHTSQALEQGCARLGDKNGYESDSIIRKVRQVG